jgi:ubiquinone/menaquinone biosynthesis C-methylase UbiE
MLSALRKWVAASELFSFNLVLRDRFIAEQAKRLSEGSRVLDIGAGPCPYRAFFAHCDYKAQDFSVLEGKRLRYGSYGDIDYVCDATTIPVSDGSFDAVVCTEVLEHHPEPIRVVKEIARVLTPGGRLIVTAPLGAGIHLEPYHFYGGYTPYWYQKFLPEAGFDQVTVKPNEGSFRFFAQESIRFLLNTRPFKLGMPVPAELCWLFVWVCLLPVLGILIPVIAKVIDRYDRDRRFTVGYHVTAVRRDA